MKRIFLLAGILCVATMIRAQTQTAEQLMLAVKQKLDQVNDYQAKGKMKMNLVFLKAPVADVKVYFKKPDKLKINNEGGISLVPKGSVNISIGSIIGDVAASDIIDAGKEEKTGWRMIKLLPKKENADVVLSTLFVDEKNLLVRKAKTTTRETGTYELDLTYGKYAAYGLADKVICTFNTKDYKLPKGVTFDYDDGTKKETASEGNKDTKGIVEIKYSEYIINKGVPDKVFDKE